MKSVDIILPCYNEEETIPLYFEAVNPVLKDVEGFEFRFLFVNDGSKDRTLDVLEKFRQERNDVSYISFSRNFGQDAAIYAGLEHSKADYVISMDVDLQDNVSLLPEIVQKLSEGYDVVNPHRADRSDDSFFKRTTSAAFYGFFNRLEGRKILPENVNCYRGLDRKAVDILLSCGNTDRYVMVDYNYIGLKTAVLDYKREKRSAGKSKYSFKKLVKHAFDIISVGSSAPAYLPIKLGSLFFAFFSVSSPLLGIFYLLGYFSVLPPYSEIRLAFILSSLFLAISFVTVNLGILGIYVKNIVINARKKPDFIIDRIEKPDRKEKEERDNKK